MGRGARTYLKPLTLNPILKVSTILTTVHAPVLSRIHTHTQPAYDITGDGVVNIADAVKVRRQSQQGSVVSLQRAGDDISISHTTLPWLVACLAGGCPLLPVLT